MSLLKSTFNPLERTAIRFQLHMLKRLLPHVHRGWVRSERDIEGIRPETDGEFLVRLRQLARERTFKRRRHARNAVYQTVGRHHGSGLRCFRLSSASISRLLPTA